MKKRVEVFHRLTLLAASICMLTACAGNKRPTQYYLLKPLQAENLQQQQRAGEREGNIIGIGPISLPKYLDRPQIITFTGDYTISISEFHQWAEPLQNNLTRVLIESLSVLLPNNRFEVYPWRSSIETRHQIAITIDHFDLNPNIALLSAHWVIETGRNNPSQQRHSTSIKKSLPDTQYESKISALSQLLVLLSTEIAESIKNQTKATRNK